MQMIFYRNLHNSPHYSVTFKEYCHLIIQAHSLPIKVTIFETGKNYFSPKNSNVMVMNNFEQESLVIKYMNYQSTKLFMLKRTSIDKKGML